METKPSEVVKLLEIIQEKNVPITEIVDLINVKLGLIQRGSNPNEEEFVLEIDYSKSLTEMIQAGRYDDISLTINEDNFIIPRILSKKKEIVTVKLLKQEGKSDPDEIIVNVEKTGLFCAGLIELLALGQEFPTLQMEFNIIAPKMISHNEAVMLSFDSNGRTLTYKSSGDKVKGVDRILCICK